MSKEAFIEQPLRTLQSNLLLRAGDNQKCFLFTSAREGDGKSTICANLAQVLASSGTRVLLIDANLRHSSLHTFFGIPNYLGLLQLLNGSAEFDFAVRKTGTGVDLLPAGVVPEYQKPLPVGDNLERLLKTARELYDVILVDSPPVLSWSDSMLLGPKTDGVVVLLRAGVTKGSDVRLLRHRLESAGAKILGSVLNSIPDSPKSKPTKTLPQLTAGPASGFEEQNRLRPALLNRPLLRFRYPWLQDSVLCCSYRGGQLRLRVRLADAKKDRPRVTADAKPAIGGVGGLGLSILPTERSGR